MSYPPQQPGGWQEPSWPAPQSGSPLDPSAHPVSGSQPGVGSPPASGGQSVSGQPVSTGQPSGAPYGGYGYPGYPGYPAYATPVAVARPNNGLAIASMVVSIVGFLGLCGYGFGGLIAAVGAILGHVARRQIRERGESGEGMAMAGIIVGWISTAIGLIIIAVIVVAVVFAATSSSTTGS